MTRRKVSEHIMFIGATEEFPQMEELLTTAAMSEEEYDRMAQRVQPDQLLVAVVARRNDSRLVKLYLENNKKDFVRHRSLVSFEGGTIMGYCAINATHRGRFVRKSD